MVRQQYYLEHKVQILESNRNWKKLHPKECKIIKKNQYWRNRDKILERHKIDIQKMKKEIYDLLGNKCNNPNCPIPKEKLDIRALQIDHIHGNGRKERKMKNNLTFYRGVLEKVKSNSGDYQLLCAYCNWLKRFNNKECDWI